MAGEKFTEAEFGRDKSGCWSKALPGKGYRWNWVFTNRPAPMGPKAKVEFVEFIIVSLKAEPLVGFSPATYLN